MIIEKIPKLFELDYTKITKILVFLQKNRQFDYISKTNKNLNRLG
jgi:hypothetical protein